MAPRNGREWTLLTGLQGRLQESTVYLAFAVEVYPRVHGRVFALDVEHIPAHGTEAAEFDTLDCAQSGGVAAQSAKLLAREPLHLLRQQIVVRHSSGEPFDELAQRGLGLRRRRLHGTDALPI